MMTQEKQTRLELAVQDGKSVAETLDWKLAELQDSTLPVEQSLADYIALGISGFDDKIEKLKAYKKQIDEAISELQSGKTETSAEVYEWLTDKGIDRLKGIYCSSITIKAPTMSVKNKFVMDITRDELIEKNLAHYEEDISEVRGGIKINKKRGSADVSISEA